MTPEEHLATAEQLVDEATDMQIDEQLGVHLHLAQLHIAIAQAAAALGATGNIARFTDLAVDEHEQRVIAAHRAVGGVQ